MKRPNNKSQITLIKHNVGFDFGIHSPNILIENRINILSFLKQETLCSKMKGSNFTKTSFKLIRCSFQC